MTNDDLEARLERFLVETARPLPAEVLEDVVAQLGRIRQERERRRRGLALAIPAFGAVAVVLMLVAVNLGPSIPPAAVPSPSGEPSVMGTPLLTWDVLADFRRTSPGANPAPDRHGNPAVWSYAYAATPESPAAPALLTVFADDIDKWSEPSFVNLHVDPGDRGVVLHPYGSTADGQAILVRWVSPVEGIVSIRGSFANMQGCGAIPADGVTVSIQHDGRAIISESIGNLGIRSFDLEATVTAGSVLEWVVEPRSNSNCDSTDLVLELGMR